jgi:hypothetical protein
MEFVRTEMVHTSLLRGQSVHTGVLRVVADKWYLILIGPEVAALGTVANPV